MAYVKQNFQDGQVLNAAALNHIEEALFSVCGDMDTVKAWMAKHKVVELGDVTLTNSLEFPFNNSKHTVALETAQDNGDYIVLTEVVDFTGNVGEVVVSDKMTNGFALSFTGSATSVEIEYVVIGGFSE